MSILRVEELEPRWLLSGACFAPQSSPRPTLDVGGPIAAVAERRSFVDSGGQVGASRTATYPAERAGPQTVVVIEAASWSVIAFRTVSRDSGPIRVDRDSGPAPDASAEPAFVPSNLTAASRGETTEAGRATNPAVATAASATAPVRAAVQAAVLLENPVAARAPAAEIAGFLAARVALPLMVAPPVSGPGELRPGAEPTTRPTVAIPQEELPGIRSNLPDSLPTSPALQPSPQLAGIPAALVPIDLAALERGLRGFVEQLETTAQALVRPTDRCDLSPWIVAVAAALAACEIARRELQRSRGASEPEALARVSLR